MTGTIVITGCSLTDVVCEIDAPGLPGITYNITRLERVAFSGGFGPPTEARFDQLTAPADWDEWSGLDRDKVLRFTGIFGDTPCTVGDWLRPGQTQVLKLLDIPTIAVFVFEDVPRIIPVDGSHRMMARQQRGCRAFSRFVVPFKLERYYRVHFEEI